MKTKYILHGGFTRKDNDLNASFFHEFTSDIPTDAKILMVFFASGDEDKTSTYNELIEKISKSKQNSQFSFIFATKENFEVDCGNADAIYFHGGNTPTLLATLENFVDIERFFIGKTIAGSSAGAYTLSAYGTAHTSEHIRQGLGIINVRVICHFESTELPPSPTSLAEIYSTHLDLPLVTLRDCESKVFFK